MWNATRPAPSVPSLLLAFAVALIPLTACPSWSSDRPDTAAPPPAAQAVPTPGAAAPATGAPVSGGSPTTTAPSSGETPKPGAGPGTGGGAATGDGAKTGDGPKTGDKTETPPPRPLERLVFDCDSASTAYTTCTAIAAGSDTGCKSIKDEKLRAHCVSDASQFIAAKGAPGDSSWRFPDSWMQRCGKGKDEPAANCEAMRDAVRSGEASKCPGEPAGLNAGCRAMATADPSLCGGDKSCREMVSRTAVIARGGLNALATEATNPAEKSYARAALGDADGCKELAAAMKSPCAAARSAAAPSTTPSSTQAGPRKDKQP